MISAEKIASIFKKYQSEGFVNISNVKSIELSYDSFMDEIAIESEDVTWATVSIIKDNRKASVSIDSCSISDIESAVSEWISLIWLSEKDSDITMPEASWTESGDFYNEELSSVNVDFLKSEFKKVKKYNFKPGIKLEDYGAWYKESETFFISSNWAYKSCRNNFYSYSIALVWEKWDLKDSAYKFETIKKLDSLSSEEISNLENELLDKLSPQKTDLKEWYYNVTLDRDVVSDFLSFVLSSFSAEAIREQMGLFAWKNIWDKILSEDVTIVNDPSVPFGIWNTVFDSEWTTCKKHTLVEKWVLVSKFCDTKNSKKEWWKFLWNSTSYNIIFESDKYSDDFLEGSTFLFTNLMAFHSVDTNTWNFSLNWEWYMIEDWKKTKYVKNISLSWNVKDIFNNIISIWNDIKISSRKRIWSVTFKDWYITP